VSVRTRFAPSPTGELHLGNARIAVLNWLYARHCGGRFVLRIEDTDADRIVPGAEEEILRSLRWLGLDWDEGPDRGGPYGPYRQSERSPIYRDFAARLLERGAAFHCYCDPAVLEAKRRAALARGESPRYDGTCRELTPTQERRFLEQGIRPSVRFRVRTGTVRVRDLLKGEVTFDADAQGDFVILKSDGRPTYNFAVVVDDLVMEITHVIRGIGHLANTPRQVLLYEALGAAPPVFVHVPHVRGPDGEPLSKRRNAPSLRDYEREGIHPDAIVNYVSLLSWSSPSGDEVLDRDRLVREIDLRRLGARDAVVDPAKLRWLSGKHIQRMPAPELAHKLREYAGPEAPDVAPELWVRIAEAVRDRVQTFAEVRDFLPIFFPPEPIPFAAAALEALAQPGTPELLEAVADALEKTEWHRDALRAALREAGAARGASGRALYRPVRLAVTGREEGPELADVLWVQGRERSVRLLRQAAEAARAAARRTAD
jgi:nondiscriminating glutamyl-tRNA synthetase